MAFMNAPGFSNDEALPLSFDEHFGQTLAEADQAWAIDERPDATWGAPCVPERTYSLTDRPVEISGDLDCREPDVYGAAYFMSIHPMCLEEDISDCLHRLTFSSQEPGFPATPYTIRIEEIAR